MTDLCRVLVISNYSGMYGSEKMLGRLIRAVTGLCKPEIILNPAVPVPFSELYGAPVAVRRFSVISKAQPLRALLDVRMWLQLLRRKRPDAVVLNISLIPAPILAARWLGIPVIVFVRESLVDSRMLFAAYSPYLRFLASALVCNSGYTASMFGGARNLTIVPDCVEAPACPIRRGPFQIRFMYVGRLSERKGLGRLVRALQTIDDESGPDLEITMVGDSLREQEGFVAAQRKICSRMRRVKVVWAGYVQNPWELAGNGSILVAPSILPETFGLTVAEALVRGLPVIASRVGAYPELVMDGQNGFICEPVAEGLGGCIRLALELDAARYLKLSEAAIESMSQYSEGRYNENIRALMRKEVVCRNLRG